MTEFSIHVSHRDKSLSAPATRLRPGRPVPVRHLDLLSGGTIDLADGTGLTHIQFRRFAGCPVCSLHLRSFVTRKAEVDAALREVVIFHSSAEDLVAYAADIPFPFVADPKKELYGSYGVEASVRALLHPRAWPAIFRGVMAALPGVLLRRQPMPPLFPKGGRYGLPADFLISPNGIVIDAHYGEHADDQWSVDDVLSIAAKHAPNLTE